SRGSRRSGAPPTRRARRRSAARRGTAAARSGRGTRRAGAGAPRAGDRAAPSRSSARRRGRPRLPRPAPPRGRRRRARARPARRAPRPRAARSERGPCRARRSSGRRLPRAPRAEIVRPDGADSMASPMPGSPLATRVLFVHHRSELGGAPESLSYLIRELDRTQFEPHVYCPPGPAAELFREAGAAVHTGSVAGFTHIWASTYRGRRWVLLARELARLPSHAYEFRRTLRRHGFELIHFNDSPLIPA